MTEKKAIRIIRIDAKIEVLYQMIHQCTVVTRDRYLYHKILTEIDNLKLQKLNIYDYSD